MVAIANYAFSEYVFTSIVASKRIYITYKHVDYSAVLEMSGHSKSIANSAFLNDVSGCEEKIGSYLEKFPVGWQ